MLFIHPSHLDIVYVSLILVFSPFTSCIVSDFIFYTFHIANIVDNRHIEYLCTVHMFLHWYFTFFAGWTMFGFVQLSLADAVGNSWHLSLRILTRCVSTAAARLVGRQSLVMSILPGMMLSGSSMRGWSWWQLVEGFASPPPLSLFGILWCQWGKFWCCRGLAFSSNVSAKPHPGTGAYLALMSVLTVIPPNNVNHTCQLCCCHSTCISWAGWLGGWGQVPTNHKGH